MTKELKLLKQVCEEMGIPWIDETGESIIDGIPASQWFRAHNIFPRAARFKNGEACMNLGLCYMQQIQFSKWRGEEKKNLISILNQRRAKKRKQKNQQRRKPSWSTKNR